MPGNRYEATIDLSNRNNSHTLIVELVGGGRRVLDVGTTTTTGLSSRSCATAAK